MPSKIQVDQIAGATGSTVTLPSGQTLDLSSGTVTLPNSAVNLTTKVTGTLPTANGGTGLTTLGTASQVLRVNSGATALEYGTISIGANAGEVIQVVSTNYTGTASSTSATPADVSGFSATITPSASANKILVFVSVCFGGAEDSYPYVLLKRNGTSISIGTTGTGNQINTFLSGALTSTGGVANVLKQHSKSFLDSPSSTSALTYQIQLAAPYAGNAGYINRPATIPDTVYVQFPTSSITLMEIKQ
jgi:hypothetical protein